MNTPIDVETRFSQYKTGYEDELFKGTQDPWHKTVVCRHGHISAYGGNQLMACTKTMGVVARQMVQGELPCEVVQHGDDGVNAVFHIDDAPTMLKVMGAKKR